MMFFNHRNTEVQNGFLCLCVSVVTTMVISACGGAAEVRVSGSLRQWEPLRLDVTGPHASETDEDNPFLNYRLSVAFTQGETEIVVPGYFAADGNAAQTGVDSGSVWRVHFLPTRPGTWNYRVSFREGSRIALDGRPESGEPLEADGLSGTLEIAQNAQAPGLLAYTGKHYLQFRGNGEYFLKAGADSPENFLAYHEFDDTYSLKAPGGVRQGEAALAPLHRYAPHIPDWKPGDPTWRGERGKGIIGALNYLASEGMNSVYFVTMNVLGDGQDVWPWAAPEERYRFDCSRLDQWEIVFSHMDRLGLMLHVVLTETENESLFEVEEGGEFAGSRKLYYRELIARFGHHRALVWNIGEENGWDDRHRETTTEAGRGNTDEQRKAFARYIRQLDPYDRPIVVHTVPGRYDEIYTPLRGDPHYEGTSLQMGDMKATHAETIKWLDRSAQAERPWVVTLDEIGPAHTGVKPDAQDPDHDEVRRYALWGNLMAGGAGVEWYFGYNFPHNDLNAEDWRSRDRMWDQTRFALEFFHQHLPFADMRHADDLVRNPDAWCLARPPDIYAVYLGSGGTSQIRLPEGQYAVRWYDPRNGGALQEGSVRQLPGGGARSVGPPPAEPDRDWVVLITRNP